jgi:hypothetical protein
MVRLIALALVAMALPQKPVVVAAPPPQCVRLSGEQIGQLPLTIQVGPHRVDFLEWKATDVTASVLVGFTAQAPEAVRFTVQAGDRTFETGANWLHPAGVVGPQVKPISSVTLCAG